MSAAVSANHAYAQAPIRTIQPAINCAAMGNLKIPADLIGLPTGGAGTGKAALIAATTNLPEYCSVPGYVDPVDRGAPRINVQINLPSRWNQKALQFGSSGYGGSVPSATGAVSTPPPATPLPLLQGYMTFSSDTGHQGNNALFAMNDEALANFGHMHIKKARDLATALAAKYFGTQPSRYYFAGSSQGGREGLIAAQRYPADYDGVIAESPIVEFTGLQLAGNRLGGATLLGGGWMNAAKIRRLQAATLNVCDALDGLADGIISKYLGCNYDPVALRCANGADTGDACLSDAQVNAARTMHLPFAFGFLTNDRSPGYPGWTRGSEADPAHGYATWVMGQTPPTSPQPAGLTTGGGGLYASGSQWIRYAIARDPKQNTFAFDPSAWYARIREVAAITDATAPNVLPFFMRGGKMIVTARSNDYAASPLSAFLYYELIVEMLGQRTVDQSMQLFVVPGANHTGDNVPNTLNVSLLEVLENWVENGSAPQYLTLSQTNPPRSRPLCRYPAYPHYNGTGDPLRASSFACNSQ